MTRNLTFLGSFVTRRLDAIDHRLDELAEALVRLQSSLAPFAPPQGGSGAAPSSASDGAGSPAPAAPSPVVPTEATAAGSAPRGSWMAWRRARRS